jgi:hypothetical protein
MYKLFIDDIRDPKVVNWVKLPEGPWVIVRNYDQFVKYITDNGLPSFVAFDHDLGQEHYIVGRPKYDEYKEKTGYDCAKWLVEYCMDNNKSFPDYIVHSMNPIGAMNIRSIVENYRNTIK